MPSSDETPDDSSGEAPPPESEERPESDVELASISIDVIFEVLKNQRRRWTLEYLEQQNGRTVLGELAEQIASREIGTTVEDLTAQQRKRVYVGLYQCHLPKMDDAGLVDFDRTKGTVDLVPGTEPVLSLLEHARTLPEDPSTPGATRDAAMRELLSEELNRRIVAPLLVATATLLVVAAVGAAVNGSVLLSAVVLPAPAVAFWSLHRARVDA